MVAGTSDPNREEEEKVHEFVHKATRPRHREVSTGRGTLRPFRKGPVNRHMDPSEQSSSSEVSSTVPTSETSGSTNRTPFMGAL